MKKAKKSDFGTASSFALQKMSQFGTAYALEACLRHFSLNMKLKPNIIVKRQLCSDILEDCLFPYIAVHNGNTLLYSFVELYKETFLNITPSNEPSINNL